MTAPHYTTGPSAKRLEEIEERNKRIVSNYQCSLCQSVCDTNDLCGCFDKEKDEDIPFLLAEIKRLKESKCLCTTPNWRDCECDLAKASQPGEMAATIDSLRAEIKARDAEIARLKEGIEDNEIAHHEELTELLTKLAAKDAALERAAEGLREIAKDEGRLGHIAYRTLQKITPHLPK